MPGPRSGGDLFGEGGLGGFLGPVGQSLRPEKQELTGIRVHEKIICEI